MAFMIPGSEHFNSRPISKTELMDRIDPSLVLHQVDADLVDALDPLTYEVVRHRLWAITQEMGTTLRHMSGSHVVTEGNDFNFAICDELGEEVQVGTYNLALVGSMDLAIFWTLQHRSANPGIAAGDMFLCNDPWVGGGLHQNDAAVLAPVFHEGKLFCWTTSICHQIDLGGQRPGSFNPSATDVFGEAVPTPPIKVVRDGMIQEDVADVWVRRSRQPHLVGLDLRALVASNRGAGERILRLVGKYGADTVKAVMRRMMDDAERQLRAKLATLPDGSWRATGYQEQSGTGDRGMYEIHVTMTKKNDQLTFDFRGTSEQVGVVNCPYAGTRAGVIFTMLPILAGDLPWAAGGLMRCFDIVADEGTIMNATFPAAVGKGPFGPAWAAGNLVAEVMSRMLDSAPAHRQQVQSVCNGTTDLCVVSGLDHRHESTRGFVTPIFDVMAGGYGAQVSHDGVDTGGRLIIPAVRAPDAEMTEYLYPLVALWRREEKDSGGPGRQRGGMSGSVCYVPHPDQEGAFGLVVTGNGKVANQNVGLAGGYPGNSQLDMVIRGINVPRLKDAVSIPADLTELGGVRDVLPVHGESTCHDTDALFLHWQAGGGYGDPILRDPELVAEDVREFRVSPQVAAEIYGVVVTEDHGSFDADGTAEVRRAIRAARAGKAGLLDAAIENLTADSADPAYRRLDDNTVVDDSAPDRPVFCAHCKTPIGHMKEGKFGHRLLVADDVPAAAGPHVWPDPSDYVDEEIVFRQLLCPGCFTAVYSRVAPRNHPLPDDFYAPLPGD